MDESPAHRWLRPKRVHTHTILQMEAIECGAASLAMVLAYHGRWVPLEELRLLCGVSRDGTKASNIIKAARHYGLAAKGFRKEPEELLDLPIPSIIHWNFNHFVVFEGMRGRHAHINDPGLGRRKVDAQEFSDSFTGVVLAMETTPEFKPGGQSPAFFRTLFERLRGSSGGLSFVLLMSLLLAVPAIVTPVFAKIFVDSILVTGMKGWLGPLIVGMAATALVRAAMIWLQGHYLLRLETKLALSTGSRFLWHLMRLPMNFFTQRHAGDLTNRIAANDDIAHLLSMGVAASLLGLVTSAFLLAAMFVLNVGLTAIALPLTLLNILVLRMVGQYRTAVSQRLMKDRSQLMGATVGLVRSIETIKAGGWEQDIFGNWAGYQAKTLASNRDLARVAATVGVAPMLFAGLSGALVLGVGSIEVIGGRISVGDLVAFLALSAAFADPINQMFATAALMQQVKGGLASIRDVLAYPLDARFAAAPDRQVNGARLNGRVEMRGVTFGYNPQEEPLISDFDLDVGAGKRVALVGASGSGKSTLGRLASGLYAPWSGEILIDGRQIMGIPRTVLANSLAYVDQDVFLFQGSVRENVTLWDHGIKDADLSQALKDAAIFGEVALRPGRQDAAVGEGGGNFSGGQRQRLEIARALAGDPAILVLDEAMAALDPVTEKQIDDNIRRRGCTCIVIAHRLSTIRDCDEIIMLEGGKAIARGSHETLMDTCAEYRRLVDAQ